MLTIDQQIGDRLPYPILSPLGPWLARLSFDVEDRGLELTGEVQKPPSIAKNSRITVFFDGVLYNTGDLLREADDGPADASSSELVLAMYQRYGAGVLNHIRGIFCLLIWDGERNCLICGRDPLGQHPLFYARAGNRYFLSPSVDAVATAPGVSRSLNRAAIADLLRFQAPDPEETYYQAVSRVVAAHVVEITESGVRRWLYWRPRPLASARARASNDDIHEFKRLLDQAVDRSLLLGEAGILLSGGIDSVTVATVATDRARQQGLPDPQAFSLEFPDEKLNESSIQNSVASGLGLNYLILGLNEVVSEPNFVLASTRAASEEPHPEIGVWHLAYRQLRAIARSKGSENILTGIGGDEWLVVGREHIFDALLALDAKGLYKVWKSARHSYHHGAVESLRMVLLDYAILALLRRLGRVIAWKVYPDALRRRWQLTDESRMPSWLARDNDLRQQVRERARRRWPTKVSVKLDPIEHMRESLDDSVVASEMEENFEVSRRLDLATSHPLLDIDLVEFLWQAPADLIHFGDRTKGLARQIIEQEFPALGFDAQRKQSAVPFSIGLLEREGPEAWESFGGVPALVELGIVDQDAVATTMSKVFNRQGGPLAAQQTWSFLCTESWIRPRM